MEFFAITQPGIEQITSEEIVKRWNDAVIVKTLLIRNGSLIVFKGPIDPNDLLSLRTTEDIYVLLGDMVLEWDRNDLDKVGRWVASSDKIESSLALHRSVHPRAGRKTTYRVVVQTDRDPKPYRRVDLQKRLEKAVAERYHDKWRLVNEGANLEFWAILSGKRLFFGLRISDKSMRHRTYKIAHLPASLKPTMAAALVLLSSPEPNDVFLDPMAGAGTILIERAEIGRYGMIHGGDSKTEAVETMLLNVGKKYKPIEIRLWDATELPLPEHTVTKIVSNLPFGKQIGTHESNKNLYPRLFVEFNRVLVQGGTIVLLTSEDAMVKDGIKNNPRLQITKVYDKVIVLGLSASIYVIEKRM